MSGRRRLMMAGKSVRSLYVYTGVDTTMSLRLSGNTLVCRSSGGAGTHGDLHEWNSPPLHLGRAACYVRRDAVPSNADVISHAAELFTVVWDLNAPLPLGFSPAKIASVEFIGSGRGDVPCGEQSGDCWITWSDDSVTVNDDEGGSSMYCFKINFE